MSRIVNTVYTHTHLQQCHASSQSESRVMILHSTCWMSLIPAHQMSLSGLVRLDPPTADHHHPQCSSFARSDRSFPSRSRSIAENLVSLRGTELQFNPDLP